MSLETIGQIVGIAVGVIAVVGGLAKGITWIKRKRAGGKQLAGEASSKSVVPAKNSRATATTQERRKQYRRLSTYLDDLVEFRRRWARFEKRLSALFELVGEDNIETEEFDELCDKLAADREWLKTRLSNLLRDRPDIEGSAAEISNAERALLQQDFRRGRMCRQFVERYHRFDEWEQVDWYELDQPRQFVRDAALALDAATQRLDREAQELYEDIRAPSDPPYQSRVK